ncbi:MAG TPA: hypothetical protein VJZ71_17000 [Phycisphaerae bacterium]|nr:hypothetical protein [Phycisphaerae bacterium]
MQLRRMTAWVGVSSLIAAAAGMGPGCQGNVNTPPPPSGQMVSFANQIQPIFNAHCIDCHSGGGPPLSGVTLNLEAGVAYAAIVNQPSEQDASFTLVVPGIPNGSLLYWKVSSDTPPVGSTMPLFGARLSANEVALLRDWIAQGAPNN